VSAKALRKEVSVDWPQNQPHTPVTSGKGRSDWRSDDRFVYIGLPGYGDGLAKTGKPSWEALFGKPWSLVPKDGVEGSWRKPYRDFLVAKIENDPIFAGAVLALHGKTLVCWCKGKGNRLDTWCHGDMLAYAAERLFHNLP